MKTEEFTFLRYSKLLETVGLLLVLVAFAWEVFFANRISEARQEVFQTELMSRLDQLHYRQKLLESAAGAKGNYLDEKWNASFYVRDDARLKRQGDFLSSIRIWLFGLGSAVIVLAKWCEYHSVRCAKPE
jgi:hypothetical protein